MFVVCILLYILQTYGRGFHMPTFDWKFIAHLAASKIISRPLIKLLNGYVPETVQAKALVVDELLAKQARNGLGRFGTHYQPEFKGGKEL